MAWLGILNNWSLAPTNPKDPADVRRSPAPSESPSPFAPSETGSLPKIGLGTLLVSMIVFAAISLLLMFAARVPAIAQGINDFFGVSRSDVPGRPDRSTHLFLLLFCYTSPLMLLLWVSFLRRMVRTRTRNRTTETSSPDPSPFD